MRKLATKLTADWSSPCRWCGLRLLYSDANKMIFHEAPVCPEFLAQMHKNAPPDDVGRWTQDVITGELTRDKAD